MTRRDKRQTRVNNCDILLDRSQQLLQISALAELVKAKEKSELKIYNDLNLSRQEARKLKIVLDETINENSLLLENLHKVQSELESYYAKLNKEINMANRYEMRQRKSDKIIKDQEHIINYMLHSKSWKITAPLRFLMAMLLGSSNKTKREKP